MHRGDVPGLPDTNDGKFGIISTRIAGCHLLDILRGNAPAHTSMSCQAVLF